MEKRKKAAGGSQRQPRRPNKPRELTPLDLLKLEIAADLGLAEKVASEGWGNLTAVETGRVGGILNKRLKDRGMAIGPRGTLIPMS